MTFLVKLACGHQALTNVSPVLVRPTDVHYFRCITCVAKWNKLVSIKEIPSEMLNVFGELPFVLPGGVLRLHSHTQRTNLFPYVK